MKLEVYLTFPGNCEEAMNFYKSCFDGELIIQRFSENTQMDVPPDHKDKILHARLNFGDNVLMASDTMPDVSVTNGTNVSLSLQTKDRDWTEKTFNKLAEGGAITMPLQDTFWNAYFGMLTDKYGFRWMINCERS